MKKICKKILCVALLCGAINSANAINNAKNFEIYGDIMQFLPAFVAIYPLATQDFEGAGWLALSTATAIGATYIIKYSFYGIAKKNPNAARISQRPNNGAFQGFPSGHTASAFVAAGFAQKRYGNALGVPCLILASLTGASRVVAEKHTILQVLGGAILGYTLGYFITQRDLSVSLIIGESNANLMRFRNDSFVDSPAKSHNYAIQISYRF
ncbi:phosphatase PAP2 family protein [Helicobacter sp. 23-1045]